MRFVPNSVSTKLFRQALILQKHSPNILFGVGIVGVVGTAVLASHATLQVESVLEEHDSNLTKIQKVTSLNVEGYDDESAQQDTILVYVKTGMSIAKLYAPAVGLGVISIAALTKSHNILSQRNVALTAAYAVIEKGFAKYRERVVNELGTEKDLEFRYGWEERETLVDTKQGPKVIVSHHAKKDDDGYSIYSRFFDELNTNWERNADYNFVFVKARQNFANDILQSKGHIFLNEVYDMLGMERSKEGQIVGWVKGNGDSYVDFGLYADNPAARDFVIGAEASVRLDFNVDGVIWELI